MNFKPEEMKQFADQAKVLLDQHKETLVKLDEILKHLREVSAAVKSMPVR